MVGKGLQARQRGVATPLAPGCSNLGERGGDRHHDRRSAGGTIALLSLNGTYSRGQAVIRGAIAALALTAVLAGGVLAQEKIIANDDAVIVARVEQALKAAHSLATARIAVHSRDGFVTLSGSVATIEQIATAGVLTAAVHGVTGVRNRIRVTDRASRG